MEGRLGGFGGAPRAITATNATNRSVNTGGNGTSSPAGTPPTNGNGTPPTNGNGAGQQPPSGGPGVAGGIFDIGTPGPLRLFTQPLAVQIVWLLPLALFGLLALAWQRRPRRQSDRQQQSPVPPR